MNKKYQINLKKNFNLNKERNELKKLIFQNKNKLYNQISKNKEMNLIERNIESPSTSEFTFDSNKKYANLNNTDDLSKDKINLFNSKSGNSNIFLQNNNKVIIPLIPLKRPNTNINFESKNIWENKNDTNERKNNFYENLNDVKYKNRVKIYSAPHLNKNINQNNSNNKSNKDIKNEINNILNNSNSFNFNKKNNSSEKMPINLNKIKFEKGMWSSKLVNLKQIPLKKRNNIFCQSINSFNLENKFMNNNIQINVIAKKHPIRITKNLLN